MKILKIAFCICFYATLVGCIKMKNRVKIVGGTYRVVTYSQSKVNTPITIKPAGDMDSILGLAISFKTSFFADGTEKTFVINTNTPGWKGPMDTMSMVKIVLPSNEEIQGKLYNDTLHRAFFMNDSVLLKNHEYNFTNGSQKSYSAYTFSGINDFIRKYNERKGDFIYRHNLDHEIFFWFRRGSKVDFNSLKNLNFKVYFTNGRVVELKPYKKTLG